MTDKKDTIQTLIEEYMPEVPFSPVLVNTPTVLLKTLFGKVVREADFVWQGLRYCVPWRPSRPNMVARWVVSPLSLWPYLHNVAFLYGANQITASNSYYSGDGILSNGSLCISHANVDNEFLNLFTLYDEIEGMSPHLSIFTDPIASIIPGSRMMKTMGSLSTGDVPMMDLVREVNRFSWWYLKRLISNSYFGVDGTTHNSLVRVWVRIILDVEFTHYPRRVFLREDLDFQLLNILDSPEPQWYLINKQKTGA